jgi:hypothetical protein
MEMCREDLEKEKSLTLAEFCEEATADGSVGWKVNYKGKKHLGPMAALDGRSIIRVRI